VLGVQLVTRAGGVPLTDTGAYFMAAAASLIRRLIVLVAEIEAENCRLVPRVIGLPVVMDGMVPQPLVNWFASNFPSRLHYRRISTRWNRVFPLAGSDLALLICTDTRGAKPRNGSPLASAQLFLHGPRKGQISGTRQLWKSLRSCLSFPRSSHRRPEERETSKPTMFRYRS